MLAIGTGNSEQEYLRKSKDMKGGLPVEEAQSCTSL